MSTFEGKSLYWGTPGIKGRASYTYKVYFLVRMIILKNSLWIFQHIIRSYHLMMCRLHLCLKFKTHKANLLGKTWV